MPSVLIVDDHEVTRSCIRSILECHGDLDVVGAAGNAQEAVEKAAALHPDIVILDIEMPGRGSYVAAREIRRLSPSTRILVCSIHDDKQWMRAAALVGASGYVVKGNTRDLLAAIDALLEGQMFFPADLRISEQMAPLRPTLERPENSRIMAFRRNDDFARK